MRDLFAAVGHALQCTEVDAKLAAVAALPALDIGAHSGDIDTAPAPVANCQAAAGRPARPRLVSPLAVPRRSPHTVAGRAALVHALAHIEFNAVNLALDATYRFRGLPREYYRDWLGVAQEEAQHFVLLRTHLRTLGYDYGDFPAHDGLWDMAVKTAHDPLARMALVPRVLEARGLDASPALIAKFAAVGDTAAVAILTTIARDEVAHVRIGTDWYRHLCVQRGIDPLTTFQTLLRVYNAPRVRPPFAIDARHAAGFSDAELAVLAEFAEERATNKVVDRDS